MTRLAPASSNAWPSSAVFKPPPTWQGRRFAIISIKARLSPWRMAASRSINCTIGYFEKRSIQYSKSSKASLSVSPCTSWTMRPPIKSIEGISICSLYGCLKMSAGQAHADAGAQQFGFERAGVGDAEVEDAGGEGGVGLAAHCAVAEDLGEVGRGAGASRGDDGNLHGG